MTDPQQQDPLAALEELLKDSKSSGDPATAGASAPESADEVAEKLAEEQKQKEVAALEEEHKAADAEALRSQIDSLKEITTTPEEQARIAQKQQHQADTKQQKHDEEEYQIIQLGHTKI